MKICTNCGRECDDNVKICPKCGWGMGVVKTQMEIEEEKKREERRKIEEKELEKAEKNRAKEQLRVEKRIVAEKKKSDKANGKYIKICRKCGNECDENMDVCPKCGTNIESIPRIYKEKKLSVGTAGTVGAVVVDGAFLWYGIFMSLTLFIVGLVIGFMVTSDKQYERSLFVKGWVITFVIELVVAVVILVLLVAGVIGMQPKV